MKQRSFRLRLACVSASLAVAAAAPPVAGALAPPASDPFYTPPAKLAQYPHGTILREREVSISGALQFETASAYQLMFRTTNATGQPVAAVTTVLVPTSPAAGPRRLASYQTYYDSLTLNCAPSYTLQGGNGGPPGEANLIATLLQQGWDVNVPDYEGLQSEWAVGPMLGRAALDSVRAAEHFATARLEGSGTRVAFTGYSGGSEAATWAGALAPRYTPELRIAAVAAGGNFPDLDYTTQRFDNSLWYGTEIGVMVAFSRAYADFDLDRLLNPAGQALAAKDGQDANGCAGATLNEPFGNASQYTNFPSSEALAADPTVKRVLDRMSLRFGPTPTAPLFLYNGASDELAYVAPVDALVTRYCDEGVTVDYDRDQLGAEHGAAADSFWSPALRYLQNAFAGDTPPDNCLTWVSQLGVAGK